MTILNKTLALYLDEHLENNKIKDYCPNGLQVEGKDQIQRVITGVTASDALIEVAIEQQADAILVHHGYFWKGENPCITGLKKKRLEKLIKNDINLLAYHLPIDAHPELGNNVQLAKRLGIVDVTPVEHISPLGVLMQGKLQQPVSGEAFCQVIEKALDRTPLASIVRSKNIETVGWCTGGGQGYIDEAAELGLDAFITGEASEKTIHSSREHGIDFFSAGHHATERYGVKAVGEHLAEKFELDVQFIDIFNPV